MARSDGNGHTDELHRARGSEHSNFPTRQEAEADDASPCGGVAGGVEQLNTPTLLLAPTTQKHVVTVKSVDLIAHASRSGKNTEGHGRPSKTSASDSE
jgi:hypothetical protein